MQLRTLGGLGLPGSDLRRPKPLLLLAYLALEGSKPRRFLEELFFLDAADPADALSTTLRRLRSVGAVEDRGEHVLCAVRCDAKELLESLDAGAVEAALPRYGGAFLETVRLPLGSELEEWVFETREFIAGRVRQAALGKAEAETSAGREETAWELGALAFGVSGGEDPTPDELSRLMRIFADSDSTVAAQIRDHAKRFAITITGEERPGLAVPLREGPSLPIPPTSLIGRDVELMEVSRLLGDPSCRLLTIHGLAGAGKTRLALQAAWDQLRMGLFDAGVAYVAAETVTLDQLPDRILSQTVTGGPSGEVAWGGLAAALRDRGGRHLLVLDGFEHLTDASGNVRLLLRECPGLKVLITSRVRLGLAEEWVLPLTGLRLPRDGAPWDEARLAEAIRLFERRAQAANVMFHLGPEDLPLTLRICRAVEGLPLGVELAASLTRVIPLMDLARELERDPSELGKESMDMGSSYPSLWAALQHSWDLLDEDAETLMASMSVFRGGFRREAASAIVGATIPDLMELVDNSLLRMDDQGRFDQHALLHHFSREKLESAPESFRATGLRHARYYTDLLSKASGATGKQDLHAAFKVLQEEESNILQSLSWAAYHARVDVLLALAEPLLWYFPMNGRFRFGSGVFDRALAELDEDDPEQHEAIASLLLSRAWLARYAGSIDEARRLASDGERFARSAESPTQLVRALDLRGQALTYEGGMAEAKEVLAEGVVVASRTGDDLRLSRIRCNLALVYALSGRTDAAHGLLDEALAPFNAERLPVSIDTVAIHLARGVTAWCSRDYAQTYVAAKRAKGLAERLEYRGPVPVLKALMAGAVYELAVNGAGRALLEEAETLVKEGLRMVQQSQEGMATSMLHGVASALAFHAGELERAVAEARLAYSVARQDGNDLVKLWSLPRLVDAYEAEGHTVRAQRLARSLATHPAAPQWVRDVADEWLSRQTRESARGLDEGVDASPRVVEAAVEDQLPAFAADLDQLVGVV